MTRDELIEVLKESLLSCDEFYQECINAKTLCAETLAAIEAAGFAIVPVGELEQALKAPMIDHSGRKRGVYDVIRSMIRAAQEQLK